MFKYLHLLSQNKVLTGWQRQCNVSKETKVCLQKYDNFTIDESISSLIGGFNGCIQYVCSNWSIEDRVNSLNLLSNEIPSEHTHTLS
jgi:hypothetical protein